MLAAVKVVDPAVCTIFDNTCAPISVEIAPPLLVKIPLEDSIKGTAAAPKVNVPPAFTVIPAIFEVARPNVKVCPPQMVKVSPELMASGLIAEVQLPVDQCDTPVKSAKLPALVRAAEKACCPLSSRIMASAQRLD